MPVKPASGPIRGLCAAGQQESCVVFVACLQLRLGWVAVTIRASCELCLRPHLRSNVSYDVLIMVILRETIPLAKGCILHHHRSHIVSHCLHQQESKQGPRQKIATRTAPDSLSRRGRHPRNEAEVCCCAQHDGEGTGFACRKKRGRFSLKFSPRRSPDGRLVACVA